MLYLDYGKQDGQWLPNENGGNENLDAIKLLQNINAIMEEEESGSIPDRRGINCMGRCDCSGIHERTWLLVQMEYGMDE